MRLIDADTLKDKLIELDLDNTSHWSVIQTINDAPTVVYTGRPVVILHGQAIYITQGHIDAMIEYERKEQVKEFIDNFMKGLNDERT